MRGFLSNFGCMKLLGSPFEACTACSATVRDEYRKRGLDFVLEALQTPKYLENLTGLTALHAAAMDADLDVEWDSEDDF